MFFNNENCVSSRQGFDASYSIISKGGHFYSALREDALIIPPSGFSSLRVARIGIKRILVFLVLFKIHH